MQLDWSELEAGKNKRQKWCNCMHSFNGKTNHHLVGVRLWGLVSVFGQSNKLGRISILLSLPRINHKHFGAASSTVYLYLATHISEAGADVQKLLRKDCLTWSKRRTSVGCEIISQPIVYPICRISALFKYFLRAKTCRPAVTCLKLIILMCMNQSGAELLSIVFSFYAPTKHRHCCIFENFL